MGNTCIITTIGQLNFFKWFISKEIYNYVINNNILIENDMNKKYKSTKKTINKSPKQKPIYKQPKIASYTPIENKVIFTETKKDIVVKFSFN
jgi:hypothetical protein